MNAADYLDQQLANQPNQTGSAAAYLDGQLASVPSEEPQQSGLDAMETYANAPFSGLENVAVDSALGGTQAVAGLLNKAHILPDSLIIGGQDYGYKAGNEGINQIEKIKNDELSQALDGNTPAKIAQGVGSFAGNVALFSALGGNNPASTTGAEGLIAKVPFIGKSAASIIPAVDAGSLSSALMPAQDQDERMNNAMFGGAVAGAGKLLGNVLSTQVTDPTKQAALQTAEDFNIPVYRTQVSDSPIAKALGSFEKDVPFSGATGKVADQVSAFNNAVNGTIGQTGNAVTPETLKAADASIGQVYNDMTSKYNLPVTPAFETELLKLNDAAKTLGDQGKEYALQNQVDNVMSHIKNGQIAGDTYQGIRSRIGGLLRGQNSSPELGQLQDLLDSHFQGAMSPEDAATFTQARGQYRNMLALEKVVANSPNEPISPAKLQGAVKSVFGDYAYAGGSDLERLARLGNVLKDNFPNSGTATRNQMYELAKHVAGPAIGVGVGAGEGYHEGGTEGAVIGAAAGLGLNRAGLTPYLYSQMSRNPSMIQSLAPGIASALIKQQQGAQ